MFGKSIVYGCLPFLFDHKLGRSTSVVLVVSPLVALMADQVSSLWCVDSDLCAYC